MKKNKISKESIREVLNKHDSQLLFTSFSDICKYFPHLSNYVMKFIIKEYNLNCELELLKAVFNDENVTIDKILNLSLKENKNSLLIDYYKITYALVKEGYQDEVYFRVESNIIKSINYYNNIYKLWRI